MSDNKEHILHTRYRVKVDGVYHTLYMQSSGKDVIIQEEIPGISAAGKTLNVVLSDVKNVIDTLGKKPVATSALALKNSNPKLENGQLGIELDTQKMKVGNGIQKYNDLEYFLTKEIPAETVVIPKGVSELTETSPENLLKVIQDLIKKIQEVRTEYKDGDELAQENPVLAKGQIAIESNTGYYKVGDGTTPYNDLRYFSFHTHGISTTFLYPFVAKKAILTALNPVAEVNQAIIELDTGNIKMGDGVTAYTDLPYTESNSSIYAPVRKTRAEFTDENNIYTAERILFESDTSKFKIADGIMNYVELPYENDNAEASIAPVSSTMVDTEENLSAENPILAYGQMAITADGTKLVIGDGVTEYNDLTPISSDDIIIKGTEISLGEDDPVLSVGQIALETDTGRWKVGDGVTTYSNLTYASDNENVPINGRTFVVKPGTVFIFDGDSEVLADYVGIKATEDDGTVHEKVYLNVDGDLQNDTNP